MSVDEYFEAMGVRHRAADCPVCIVDKPSEPHRGFVSSFWHKSYAPWVLLIVLLLAAYIAVIKLAYVIVGGL